MQPQHFDKHPGHGYGHLRGNDYYRGHPGYGGYGGGYGGYGGGYPGYGGYGHPAYYGPKGYRKSSKSPTRPSKTLAEEDDQNWPIEDRKAIFNKKQKNVPQG